MKKELRQYQKDACNAVVKAWKQKEIPCVSMMTALGKALCAAALTNYGARRNMRVLNLVPTSELVSQNFEECFDYLDDEYKGNIGIVCSQLNKKQKHKQLVIAMYQSFYSHRDTSGIFDMVIVDEAHLISNNPDSRYRKIIKSLQRLNKNLLICGWTASPYRLGQGLLTEKCLKGEPLFTTICYDTSITPGIKALVDDGYLAKIEVVNTHYSIDLSGVRLSGGEYNQSDVGVKFDKICDDAVEDIKKGFIEHNIETALIFVPNCASGEKVLSAWGESKEIRMVSNQTSVHDRKLAVDWFKNGKGNRYLVNVNIYTTGFNMPSLNAVVLLRATTSPGLLIQTIGRIIRPYGDMVGKIFDYGSNLERLTNGGIENIIIPKGKVEKGEALKKECLSILDETIIFEGITYIPGQACEYKNNLSAKRCKKCKAEFINESEDGLYQMRTRAEALKAKQEETFSYDVHDVYFEHYQKDETPMIKMLFYDEDATLLHTEYICLNHSGSARGLAIAKIQSLLKNKKDYYQISKFENGICVKSVLFLLQNHYQQFFKPIKKITLQKDGRFNKLLSWEF